MNPIRSLKGLAAIARAMLTMIVVLYGFARFGAAAGLHMLLAGAVILLLEAWQVFSRTTFERAIAIGLMFCLVFAVAFAPGPFGFGSVIPGPVMMESPLFFLMLCVLGSYASTVDPWLMACASVALLAAWIGVILKIQADPLTITRANLHISDYKTALELLRALNQPHYLHTDFWRADFIAGAAVSFILCFAAFRVRRLARRRAEREGARKALAAHFSPQIAELLSQRGPNLPPDVRQVAVLNCDLVRFSAQAESLPPETVVEILALYRSIVIDAVFRLNGAILNFVGDGVVAVFGLADRAESMASEAISAAENLLEAWRAAKPPVGLPTLPDLAIGVDYGAARVGIVGERRSLSLFMQGAPIDGAADLQASTRIQNAPILISAGAVAAASASIADRLKPLDDRDHRVWRPIRF
jgi:adenylate cyclase